MANRRYIDTNIIKSLKFSSMSKSAQACYLHLMAWTDDHGVAEAGAVIRSAGIRKTALQELETNGFIETIEQSFSIVWVKDWQTFNRPDPRYGRNSLYLQTLREHFPNKEFKEFTGENEDKHAGNTRESNISMSINNNMGSNSSSGETTTHNTPPTVDDVVEYAMNEYGLPNDCKTELQRFARKFIRINSEQYAWKRLANETWESIFDDYCAADKSNTVSRLKGKNSVCSAIKDW